MRRSTDWHPRLPVAQPPSWSGSPLDRVPLAVGLLRPQDDEDPTLFVKLTFTVAPTTDAGAPQPGAPYRLTAVLSPQQEPVSLPRPSTRPGAAEGDLERPLDFAPNKPSPEVVLVGSAHASPPAPFVRCRVAVAGVTKSFVAVAGGPSHRIPLSSAYLRAEDGVSPAAPVGPQRSAAASPAARGEVAGVPAGATIELWGLSQRAPHVEVVLPGLAPRARLVGEEDAYEEVIDLICDTVCIDTDQEVIVTWWRGALANAFLEQDIFEYLLVSLEEDSGARSLAALSGALARGVLHHAVEPVDLLPKEASAPDRRAEDLAIARFGGLQSCPEPLMPLEGVVAIAAALAEGRETRAATLLRFSVTEEQFICEERAWQQKMADQAMEGDPTLAAEYGERFVEAQDALGTPEEEATPLEEYVAVRARIEWAGDPSPVLRERGWTLARWMRLDRRWTRNAEGDPAVEAEIERLLAEELDQLGPPPEVDVDTLMSSATTAPSPSKNRVPVKK